MTTIERLVLTATNKAIKAAKRQAEGSNEPVYGYACTKNTWGDELWQVEQIDGVWYLRYKDEPVAFVDTINKATDLWAPEDVPNLETSIDTFLSALGA